jgi:hypothetical protein
MFRHNTCHYQGARALLAKITNTRVLQIILPVILARRTSAPDDDMCCVETCRSYG